jgi:hypothetical protein
VILFGADLKRSMARRGRAGMAPERDRSSTLAAAQVRRPDSGGTRLARSIRQRIGSE